VKISSTAGKPADPSRLLNVPKRITAYYELRPDPSNPRQRVVFGTSGHRGSSTDVAFNEWYILEEEAQTIVSETCTRRTRAA
jgi:phosphoglucomutase